MGDRPRSSPSRRWSSRVPSAPPAPRKHHRRVRESIRRWCHPSPCCPMHEERPRHLRTNPCKGWCVEVSAGFRGRRGTAPPPQTLKPLDPNRPIREADIAKLIGTRRRGREARDPDALVRDVASIPYEFGAEGRQFMLLGRCGNGGLPPKACPPCVIRRVAERVANVGSHHRPEGFGHKAQNPISTPTQPALSAGSSRQPLG
jgi:hypothetical protein